MPLAGGPPVTICDVPGSGWGSSWGEDGTIIFASNAGISKVSSNGGTATAITKPDAAKGERIPAVGRESHRPINAERNGLRIDPLASCRIEAANEERVVGLPSDQVRLAVGDDRRLRRDDIGIGRVDDGNGSVVLRRAALREAAHIFVDGTGTV